MYILCFFCGSLAADTLPLPIKCSTLSENKIQIIKKNYPIIIEQSKSILELNTMYNNFVKIHKKIMALTFFKFDYNDTLYVYGMHSSGGFCSILSGKLEIPNSPIIVYIPLEIEKNSCAFRTLLFHEMKHANTKQQQIVATLNKITELTNEEKFNPIFLLSEDAANYKIQSIVNEMETEIAKIVNKTIINDEFDDLSESFRVFSLCPVEFKQLREQLCKNQSCIDNY